MGRQYQWRWHCPRCGRPYAKRTLLMRHHKSCTDPYSPRWERVKVGLNHVWKPVSGDQCIVPADEDPEDTL